MRRAALAAADRVPDPGPAGPWSGRPVRVDGSVSLVRETPERPGSRPAAYVHGLGGSGLDWVDLADRLSPWLHGQAIDLPGCGGSAPLRRYGLAALSDRVIRWLEEAGRGPVHLFGHSLGGALTLRVAALRPDLVRSLTLVAPAMPFLNPARSVHGWLVPLMFMPGAGRVLHRALSMTGTEELVRRTVDDCFADPDAVPPERLAEMTAETRRRVASPWYSDAYVRSLRGLTTGFVRAYLPGTGSLWRLASSVRVPTLVVWGRQDRVVDVRLAPRVARLIPESRLLILDRAGHGVPTERPHTVARAVLGLLDEIGDVPAPAVPHQG